jgi:hypothetical protein
MYLPATQRLLQLQPLELATWLQIALVSTTIVVAVELHKWLRRPVS